MGMPIDHTQTPVNAQRETSFSISRVHYTLCICDTMHGSTEWIITVGHRSNSEPNLPRAEQFNGRADIVAGLPASEMKGAIKKRAWPMCLSDCEARSMATKRKRVSTHSSDSSMANKKKRQQVSVAIVTVVLHCTTDEHDPSLPRIALPFERRVFRGCVMGFHETVRQGRTQANCMT